MWGQECIVPPGAEHAFGRKINVVRRYISSPQVYCCFSARHRGICRQQLSNMSAPPPSLSVCGHHFSSNNLDFESRWCNTRRWNQSSAAHHMVSLAHFSSELSYDQSAEWSDLSVTRNVPLMNSEKRWGERQTLPSFCLTEAIEERHTRASPARVSCKRWIYVV